MPRTAAVSRLIDDWRIALSVAVGAATWMTATVLVMRRLGGHFPHPLSPIGACTVTMPLAALGILAWFIHTWPPKNGRVAFTAAAAFLALAPAFAAGLAVLRPGSTGRLALLAAVMLALAIAMAAATATRCASEDSGRSSGREPLRLARHSGSVPVQGDTLWQWISRTTGADGREQIEGSVRLCFAPGTKKAVAHIAFCPPLRAVPQFECHLLDDAAVRVKPAEVQPYGVRVEAHRSDAAVEEAVAVAFSARAEVSQSIAA